ncbi:MAG: hypothetical protein ACRDCX_09615, partial [Aeromonas sp.]
AVSNLDENDGGQIFHFDFGKKSLPPTLLTAPLYLVRAKRWWLLFDPQEITAIILLNEVGGYPLVTRRFSSDKATAPE